MSVPCEVPTRVAPHRTRTHAGRRRGTAAPRSGRLALVEQLPPVVPVPVTAPTGQPARPLRSLGECGPHAVRIGEWVPEARAAALRLTMRGRRVVAGLVATVVIVTVGVAAWRLTALVTGPDSPIPADAPATVVVQPGDSLWSIARTVAPDADARAVVQELVERNDLESSQVRAGERLVVAGR